jgi:hypothetical protein
MTWRCCGRFGTSSHRRKGSPALVQVGDASRCFVPEEVRLARSDLWAGAVEERPSTSGGTTLPCWHHRMGPKPKADTGSSAYCRLVQLFTRKWHSFLMLLQTNQILNHGRDVGCSTKARPTHPKARIHRFGILQKAL